MQFLISILISSLISTCSSHVADACRHASSDFIRAEKCGHCASHGGSKIETVSHHSSDNQVTSTNVKLRGNGSIPANEREASKNIDAVLQLLGNVENIFEANQTEQIAHSTSHGLPRSPSDLTKTRKSAQDLEILNQSTIGDSRADSSQLASSPMNLSTTSYHSSQPELITHEQSIDPKNDLEAEGTGESGASLSSWFSPKQIGNAVKYALTNFLSESPLDTISKNLNSSRHGEDSSTFRSVYPIVLEGISVLANRLTDDHDDKDEANVAKGRIVGSLMNTINQALKFDNDSVAEQNFTQVKHDEGGNAFGGIQKIIESGLLQSTVSLVDQILKNEDFQNITLALMNKSSTADVKAMFNKASDVLQRTVFGFENALKHKDLILAMTKSSNGPSGPANLANIVSQYISKNGTADLSKNPLLQSAFVSKALSKSPVAHLGALDDDIKKLVTSSMEKAMSRIRIGETGEIQMSDGMRKMLSKMVKEHEKARNGTSDASQDSIMDMIQLVVKSGNIKEIAPVDKGPVKRRNVTRHSPLHRKFQLKYGKNGGYAAVHSGLHHTLLLLLSLTIVPMI